MLWELMVVLEVVQPRVKKELLCLKLVLLVASKLILPQPTEQLPLVATYWLVPMLKVP